MGKQYELEVKVVSGLGLPAVGDAVYVEVELNGRTVKTRTVKAAEGEIKWGQCLYPGYFKGHELLRVVCKQGKGDLVGNAQLPLKPYAKEGKEPKKVDLEGGKGSIILELGAECKGDASSEEEPAAEDSSGAEESSEASSGSDDSDSEDDLPARSGCFGLFRASSRTPTPNREKERSSPAKKESSVGNGVQKKEPATPSPRPAQAAPIKAPSVVKLPEEKKELGKLFGRPLDWVLEDQAPKYPNLDVPAFIHDATRYIREHGLDAQGIFRIRGKISDIKELKEKLDKGEQLNFEDVKSIHIISTLVKQYLRELPIPVLTYSLYDRFLKCTAVPTEEQKLDRIKRTARKLPLHHLALLQCILLLFYDVSQHADVNKMNAENLAKVMAPNLIWKETVNIQDLSQIVDAKKLNDLAECMIINCKRLFPLSQEKETEGTDSLSEDEKDEDSDSSGDEGTGGNQRGIMDNLLSQMRDGSAFKKTG